MVMTGSDRLEVAPLRQCHILTVEESVATPRQLEVVLRSAERSDFIRPRANQFRVGESSQSATYQMLVSKGLLKRLTQSAELGHG